MLLNMTWKKALIIPDSHHPFAHKKAYSLMLKAARNFNPDEIVILGDFADFYSVSSHKKDPRISNMLVEEIAEVHKRLDELDRLFPKAKKVFISGNHEHRLERYLTDQAPALFGVTSTRHVLKLDNRPGWKFIPYGPNQLHSVLGSHLHARHEPLSNSAQATAAKAMCSLVYGHIHRITEDHSVSILKKNHVCFSVGWLGDKSASGIFDYVKNHHSWQLGFGIVDVNTATRQFYHQKIHILERGKEVSCVVNGKKYSY